MRWFVGKDEMYRSAHLVQKVHKGAIWVKIKNKKCQGGVDECTDEQRHAITKVLRSRT